MDNLRVLPIGDDYVVNALRSNGKSKHPDDINVLEVFYNKYKKIPYLFSFEVDGIYFNWNKLYSKLKDSYPDLQILFKDESTLINKNIKYTKQQTLELKEGILLQLEGTIASDLFIESHDLDEFDNIVTFSLFLTDGDMDKTDESILFDIFKSSMIEEKESITIGMVSFEEGNFYVKDFDIKNKIYELSELDLHYGEGFEEFDKELQNRLLNVHKGLTLFHGEAGTGKCVLGNTKIKVRNKKTGKIEEINIKNLM